MIDDKIYKNLGIAVLAIVAIYIVLKGFNYQTRFIEGLTNKTDTKATLSNKKSTTSSSTSATGIAKIQKDLETLSTILSVKPDKKKDQVSHEEFLIDFEELISSEILLILLTQSDAILKMSITEPTNQADKDSSDAAWNMVNKLNELNKFKATLSDAAKSWDNIKKKSKGMW